MALASFLLLDKSIVPLTTMIIGLSKLAALCVLFIMVSVSHCTNSNLRGQGEEAEIKSEEADIEQDVEAEIEREEAEIEQEAEAEIEYVTMEEIMAELELQDFFGIMDEGHRKLQDDTCWHGGQENQVLTWLGVNWGSCGTMNPCLCGMSPRAMASWCPTLCRPSCGGSCATPDKCPSGFNLDLSGNLVTYYGEPDRDTYPSFWPSNWGPECYWYTNVGTRSRGTGGSPAPAPTQQPQYNVGGVDLCEYIPC